MVDNDGSARLADFGLSTLPERCDRSIIRGVVRFMAPELLISDSESELNILPSIDIYSYAGLCLQV